MILGHFGIFQAEIPCNQWFLPNFVHFGLEHSQFSEKKRGEGRGGVRKNVREEGTIFVKLIICIPPSIRKSRVYIVVLVIKKVPLKRPCDNTSYGLTYVLFSKLFKPKVILTLICLRFYFISTIRPTVLYSQALKLSHIFLFPA